MGDTLQRARPSKSDARATVKSSFVKSSLVGAGWITNAELQERVTHNNDAYFKMGMRAATFREI